MPQTVQDATAEALEDAQEGDEPAMQAAIDRRTAALAAWESEKAVYRWGNTLLIPLAFAAFGVFRWWLRANKKASLRV